MKKILFYVLPAILILLAGFAVIWVFRIHPKQNEKAREQAIRQLRKEFGADPFIPPPFPLFVPGMPPPPFAPVSQEGTSRQPLPELFKFYMADDWKQDGSLEIRTDAKGMRVKSDEYVKLITKHSFPKPGALLLHLKVRGKGRLAPFILANDNIGEKEFYQNKVRISTFLPTDYYFIFPMDNPFNMVWFGLELRGDLLVSQYEFTPIFVPEFEKKTYLSGTVHDLSVFPDPKTSAYPDCLYSIHFRGYEIRYGKPVPRDFLLLADAFRANKIMESGNLKKGDRLEIAVVRFLDASEKVKATQQADTLDLFDLERYYLCSFSRKTTAFVQQNSPIPFLEDENMFSPSFKMPPLNPPLPPECIFKREDEMEKELRKVNELVKQIQPQEKLNRDFNAAWAKKQKEYKPLKENMIWGRMGNSFASMPSVHQLIRPFSIQHNMEALMAFNDFLKLHNVQLIVALIPDMNDFSARFLNPDFASVPDAASAIAAKTLLEHDIEAIYMTDKILKAAPEYEFAYQYPSDGHPMELVHSVISDHIANLLLKRFPGLWRPILNPNDFSEKTTDARNIFILPGGVDIGKHKPGEHVQCRQILYKGKDYTENNEKSRILVIGNSFIQTPFPCTMTFSAFLARRLMYPTQERCIPATGPAYGIPLEIFKDPDYYLRGKVVCILPIPASHLSLYNFLNLRKVEKDIQFFRANKPIGEVPIKEIGRVSVPEKLAMKWTWQNFHRDVKNCMQMAISEKYIWNDLPVLEVPPEFRNREDLSLCIQSIFMFAGSTAELKVNDEILPLTLHTGVAAYKIIVPLKKGTEKIHISLRQKSQEESFISILKIQIYPNVLQKER